MKTQNWIDGTAFVGGLAIAAAIWAGAHGTDAGWHGSDKQFIRFENVAASNNGQAENQQGGKKTNGSPLEETSGQSANGQSIKQSTGQANGQLGGDSSGQLTGPSSGTSQLAAGQANDWTAPIEAAPRPYRPITSLSMSSLGDYSTGNQSNSTPAPANRNNQPKQAAQPTKHPDRDITQSAEAPKLSVRVYLTDSRRVERVPLEQYVRGVLAAEMPADFEPAALQAQALAARTYIVRRLLHEDRSGVPTTKADVTDTQTHQVYRSKAEMEKLRKGDEKAWQAIDEAASGTQGLVIAYEGEPIDALYFSSSNGYTENSEDVFGFALPYLRSVDSPWDKENTPHSTDTVTLPIAQFYDKLGIQDLPVLDSDKKAAPHITVQSRTVGKRIGTLAVGDMTLTGVQIRDKLGLRSADFSWQISEGIISFTTHGNGHGVGMSQWGAEGMALTGYSADQIISHYYKGTELVEVSRFL